MSSALVDNVAIDIDRLWGELETLSRFSDSTPPAVTRVLWTAADMQGRAYLKSLFVEAELEVRQDAIGNIFARWKGTEAGAIGTGSHTDAIPDSGRFDGTVGVLGALEALRALKQAGFVPRRSLELLLFTSEEPTRFGMGCLGSRALSEARSSEDLAALTDGEGNTVETVRTGAGFVGSLAEVPLSEGYYDAFVELHIEQGPILETTGTDIGAVTAIAAPAALRVTLTGEGGHAGAVLMPVRRDALLAASEIALAVERAALESGHGDTVATTGVLRVHPGAVNSIPSRVDMEIDIRDTNLKRRDRAVFRIIESVNRIATARKIAHETEILNADPPAVCSSIIAGAIEEISTSLGLSVLPMVSRAYHDSLFMARLAPTAMIFIPCRGGVSHRPDEYSTPEQIAAGVAVLAQTLARLSLMESVIQ